MDPIETIVKQIEQGIQHLNVDDVDHRVDRAPFEKRIADAFIRKGITYKKGSNRFTPEHWNLLNELAQKHKEPERTKVVKTWLQEKSYTFHDVKQTIKEYEADIPSEAKGDGRSFVGAVPALLVIASNMSSAGSSAAIAGKDHGKEVMSKLAPASPTPASTKSAQPASSGDSAKTADAEGLEDSQKSSDSEEEDIEVIKRPLTTDEMLQKLKLQGVVHGQDPKKVARVVDIESALKVQKVEFDLKLKKDEKIRLLYDAMCSV